MTAEQHGRWMDFSTRLARHGWPEATARRKDRIAEVVDWFISQYEGRPEEVDGWDGNGKVYVCDDLSEFLGTHCHRPMDVNIETRFERQVSSCVRARLDVAVEPSAGVVGFDVGTLRRMYDGELPPWVAEWFTPPLTEKEPDAAGVWL